MTYSVLGKRIYNAKKLDKLVILSSTIDVLIGILSIFFSFLLLPAVISSCITGIILCIGFGLYNKLSKKIPFAAMAEQVTVINIQSKVFSKSNIILSIVDIITGLIAMFVIGIVVNNTIINVLTCITLFKGSKLLSSAIGSMVQLKKLRSLYLTLGLLSVSYISLRKNHFLKDGGIMKKFFNWLKTNPRVLAAIGLGLAAVVLLLIEFFVGLNLPEDITTYLIGGLTTLGTIFAGWAGLEFPKTAEARKEAVKKLKADAKLAKQQEKENAEYIAKAQAQLQASQDAQIKALAEQLKQKENETKNVSENITSL